MTFSQSLNPHSFVVFMTLAMGISYAFFNSRRGFSLGKLITLLILIIPFAGIGFERGHSIDVGLGAFIGWLTARDGIGFFSGVIDVFKRLLANRPSPRRNEQAHSHTQNNHQQAEDEFKRRQQQAERDRQEQAPNGKGQHNKQSSSGQKNDSQKQSNEQSKAQSKSQSKSQSNKQQHRPTERKKTTLELAYDLLGVTPSMTYDEAKKMYRKLISRHHEDKLHGLPESEVEESREKSKAINVAWDLICANRGWK